MSVPRFVARVICIGAMVVGTSAVFGQDPATGSGQVFPNKPIRIATAAAGGGADFDARQIAQGISGPLGQPVIVDNRGSGVVLYDFLSKAPPDGYSLVVAGGSFWIFPLLQKVPYDIVRDFAPISLIETSPSMLVVHPSVPAKSVKELIALAKSRPGQLNYASTIYGGPAHLATELFKSMAGVDMVNVSYKGGEPSVTALIGGEVQVFISDVGLLAPHVKSGKIRALAVTTARPSALAPGLPTVAASGLPGYEQSGVTGSFAPGKTPAAIINRLNQEIARFLNRPDVKERFLNAGVEPVSSSPEELSALMKSDIAKWSKLIKDAGIKTE